MEPSLRAGHHDHVISMSRARRVVSKDAGQLGRALASLIGLAVAIAAAVGVGSMMGGSDRQAPIAQRPAATSGDGAVTADPTAADDVFGGLLGGGGSTDGGSSSNGGGSGGGGGGGEVPEVRNPRGPDPDVDLPDNGIDLPGSPVPVPTTSTLPDADVEGIIDDLAGQDDGDLVTDLVGGVTGLLGD